jgi:hypothetical protein
MNPHPEQTLFPLLFGYEGGDRLRLAPNRHEIGQYEVTTDSAGRRFTANPHPSLRKRHLLLFGCSFTFGAGVPDDQTLPSQLAAIAQGYHVYNYGRVGAGPTDLLDRIQSTDLKTEVSESEGIGVYVMIPDHVRRVPPSLFSLLFRRDYPYYFERSDGTIARASSFAEASPWLSLFYNILAGSQTASYFHFDIPTSIRAQHVRFAARIVREMRDEYLKRFPRDRFVVVMYPWPEVPGMLAPYLEAEGLDVLDYSAVSLATRLHVRDYVSSSDHHPSAAAHHLVAEAIANDLSLVQ